MHPLLYNKTFLLGKSFSEKRKEPFPVKSEFDLDIIFGKRTLNLVADKENLRF